MTHPFRKAGEPITVAFRSGGFSDNLHATRFSLEASTDKIVLGIDLAAGERTGSSDRHHGAAELLARHTDLQLIQIQRGKSLTRFDRARATFPDAAMELEFRFDNRVTRRIPGTLLSDQWNLWFEVPASEPVPRIASLTGPPTVMHLATEAAG